MNESYMKPPTCGGLCEPGTCEECMNWSMDCARERMWAEHGMDEESVNAARAELRRTRLAQRGPAKSSPRP